MLFAILHELNFNIKYDSIVKVPLGITRQSKFVSSVWLSCQRSYYTYINSDTKLQKAKPTRESSDTFAIVFDFVHKIIQL